MLDSNNGKLRLNLPARISPTGKRQRLWFAKRSQALKAAKELRKHYDQFGRSLRMLPPARLIEAIECSQMMLDEVAGQPVPPGQLREIVNREIETLPGHYARVSFDLLWMEYLEYLESRQKTPKYIEAVGYCRNRFSSRRAYFLLPHVTSELLEEGLVGMSPGHRNFYQDILRAGFNLAIRRGWLKENPVLRLEKAVYPKPEIRALSNEVVAADVCTRED